MYVFHTYLHMLQRLPCLKFTLRYHLYNCQMVIVINIMACIHCILVSLIVFRINSFSWIPIHRQVRWSVHWPQKHEDKVKTHLSQLEGRRCHTKAYLPLSGRNNCVKERVPVTSGPQGWAFPAVLVPATTYPTNPKLPVSKWHDDSKLLRN